jgi:phosphoheptose isomerase
MSWRWAVDRIQLVPKESKSPHDDHRCPMRDIADDRAMSGSPEEVITRRLIEGAELHRDFARASTSLVKQAAVAIEECLREGHKVLVVGNGGSAADAQHLAAELIGRFAKERTPLPAIALTTDTSALTAIGNDYGFAEVFARQVQALAQVGDVLIALSTSGRSPNVINAVRAARSAGAATVALTGGDGGDLATSVDIGIVVDSADTARIQEVHIAVVHILCELIEASLFPANAPPVGSPSGIVELDALLTLRQQWRREGRVLAWTNGCFDVLHVGHIHCLEQAKHFGDILVVGVNSDDSVRALKGPGRPIFPLAERMRMLAALKAPDYVVAFADLTPEATLADLQPDVDVKGRDYAPPSGKPMAERSVIESYGGRIEFVDLLPSHSTSSVIESISGSN